MTCRLILGDALVEMPGLASGSVNAVVTSPPYGLGKLYESDSYGDWLALMFGFFSRLTPLAEDGFVAVVVADVRCQPEPFLPRVRCEQVGGVPTTQDLIDAVRDGKAKDKASLRSLFGVSDQTIDRRLKGNNARGSKQEYQTRVRLSAADVTRAAEPSGFFLYDSRVWVKDPCWQTCQYHSTSYRAVDEFEHVLVYARAGANPSIDRERLAADEWGEWGSRGAWLIPSVRRNDDHPAKFPTLLAERLVRLLSPQGGMVLDPFMGSGTTGVAAVQTGRAFIGIERDAGYFAIAEKRIAEAKEEANPPLFSPLAESGLFDTLEEPKS